MTRMIELNLYEIADGITNRDHGKNTVRNLKQRIYEEWKSEADKESMSDSLSVRIFIDEDRGMTESFIDEIVYRLEEGKYLDMITFATSAERVIRKLKTISNNRGLTINAIIKGEATMIEPSREITEEPEVIIEDL